MLHLARQDPDRHARDRAAQGFGSLTIMRRPLRAVVFGLSVWLCAAAGARTAWADSFSTFVQITCVPEIGYFSIRRFGLWDVPYEALDREGKSLRAAMNPRGVYTSINLKDAPVECALAVGPQSGKAQQSRIRVVGFFDDRNGQATSYRQIVDYVDVSVDGKSIGGLSLNPHGLRTGYDQLEVWFSGSAVSVRTCSYYEHDEDPQRKAGCITEP
jgi:hypothetical protein